MSLWLNPKRKAQLVSLDRFTDYAGFFYSFQQYGVKLPARVAVHWEPLEPYLEAFADELDEAPDFIEWVEGYMESGGDVPPLLVANDEIFDGRHRAWAAHHLGIKKAPVVDISPYWKIRRL